KPAGAILAECSGRGGIFLEESPDLAWRNAAPRDPERTCWALVPSLARRHPVPRTLLCCAALAVLPLPSRADQKTTSSEMVIRLTVQPMAAPKPALRYLLLPELKEMNPGNPILGYYNCCVERSPGREGFSAAALRQADRAARLDKPDWQILLRVKTEGIS